MPQQRDAHPPVEEAQHQHLFPLTTLLVFGTIQRQHHLVGLPAGRPGQLEIQPLAELEDAQQPFQALVLRGQQNVQVEAFTPLAERTLIQFQKANNQTADEFYATFVASKMTLNGIVYGFLFILHWDSLGRVCFAIQIYYFQAILFFFSCI